MKLERIRPYTIVKPDGIRYLQELEQTLQENRINITSIFSIKDWGVTARAIYEPQLRSSDRAFNVGFETHLWLTQHLFGNRGLLLILEVQKDIKTLAEQVSFVYRVRNLFRDKLSESIKGTFVIAVNLDRLHGEVYTGAGKPGQLGVLNQGSFFVPLVEVNSNGRWDDHYFKYIHTPDSLVELEYEWGALVKQEVITREGKIPRREWGLLKILRSSMPPGEYKQRKKNEGR